MATKVGVPTNTTGAVASAPPLAWAWTTQPAPSAPVPIASANAQMSCPLLSFMRFLFFCLRGLGLLAAAQYILDRLWRRSTSSWAKRPVHGQDHSETSQFTEREGPERATGLEIGPA